MDDASTLWAALSAHLRSRVSEAVWLTSFHDIRPLEHDGERLVLAVDNSLMKERFETRHLGSVREALGEMGLEQLQVVVQVHDGLLDDRPMGAPDLTAMLGSSPPDEEPTETGSSEPASLVAGLNPRYRFDDFVIGDSNRFAHAAALAVAETPARSYNPLFIHGGSGLGKTHLLHAIAHYVHQNYRDFAIRYVSTETFLNEYVEAIRTNATTGFKRRYRDIDILLVDDIQFMEGKEGLQEEFFHTFNSLHGAGRQIVLSSDRPPKGIATLEDRLRSRFEWGLITDIQPPDLETRMAILRKKSEADQTPIPHEVIEFIASNITTNIRELEGALIRVSAWGNLNRAPLTVDLATRVLSDIVSDRGPRQVTVDDIIDATSQMFGFTVDELKGKQRHRALVTARQVSMYVSRELTDLSYPAIARAFGGRDHTTVMYAFDKISAQMAERRQTYDQVTALINQLKNQV